MVQEIRVFSLKYRLPIRSTIVDGGAKAYSQKAIATEFSFLYADKHLLQNEFCKRSF